MSATTPTIDPRHTILLVMDYQTAILQHLPDADALLSRMSAVLAVARRCGVRIGYVRVAFDDADYDAVPATNKGFTAVAGSRRLSTASPDSAIHAAVAPAPGDLIVRKTRVGAFSTTDLDLQLKQREIDTLILAGVSTSGVVLSTVRDAADRDYRLYVLEDGCADPNPEAHTFLTQQIFPRQADVITAAALPALLGCP